MNTTCECGCGRAIPEMPHHKRMGTPRFLHGHNRRGRQHRITPPADWKVPSGFCECGCGEKTTICRNSNAERGLYYGYPLRYVQGHVDASRFRSGEAHPNWSGGVQIRDGYRFLHMPGHRLARKGYVAEHRLVWESANGRPLRRGEDVHHIDGNRLNNVASNLVALTKAEHTRHHGTQSKHSERMRRWWAERKAG